ncbi:hypothetical protein [Streptococcus gallolyticus]|nr:hypothetical protein [Streptococcus gallolyticus]
MSDRKRATTFIFEQQLKSDYWNWDEEKKEALSGLEREQGSYF